LHAHILDFQIYFQTFCKLYFCLGLCCFFAIDCEKEKSGMENVPCEVFMNEAKIETKLNGRRKSWA